MQLHRPEINHQRFRKMVANLLMELVDCWQRRIPEVLIAGAAYMITMKHWKEAKSEFWQNPFSNDEEEMHFFKKVKCEFTGRLAYYNLLYESLASLPTDMQEQRVFWSGELERFNSFAQKNSAFIEYLQRDYSHFDEEYFLRRTLTTPVATHQSMFDGDPAFCTSRDYLVSAWFAERQYRTYVTARLDT